MQRRSFIQASLAGLSTAAVADCLAADAPAKPREMYELRTYRLKPEKLPLLDAYLSKAVIPALKRHGIGPVGVFAEDINRPEVKVFVLIVHPSAELAATLAARLNADEEYLKAAAEFMAVRASDPAYLRIESSILSAIEGMPKMDKPDASKPRLLNLRVYESHNERAAQKKIEMFNKGELSIFKRVGLTPVFFAETIVGGSMPNLTYLLVFPDEPGRKSAWERFIGDPEWTKLKAIPEYADKEIVSRITNYILTPRPYSEI